MRFDVEVYDTTLERDLLMDRDFFVDVPRADSRDIRAKVVKVL